jgi:hypothetical protein
MYLYVSELLSAYTTCHTRTVLSELADATSLPLGDKAIAQMPGSVNKVLYITRRVLHTAALQKL